MKVEDLAHVFKASPVLGGGEDARSLAVSLLNKFELALCWDARALLVPPLLPPSEPQLPQLALKPRRALSTPHSSPFTPSVPTVRICARAHRPLRRLLLLSYVPRGFWARLCARVLADPALAQYVPNLYSAPKEVSCCCC